LSVRMEFSILVCYEVGVKIFKPFSLSARIVDSPNVSR
jgi:hypothetical protein